MKKKLAVIGTAMMMAAAITACGGKDTQTTTAAEITTEAPVTTEALSWKHLKSSRLRKKCRKRLQARIW